MKPSNAEKQIVQKLSSKFPEGEEGSPYPGKYSRDSAAAQRAFSVSFLPFPLVRFFSQSYLLN